MIRYICWFKNDKKWNFSKKKQNVFPKIEYLFSWYFSVSAPVYSLCFYLWAASPNLHCTEHTKKQALCNVHADFLKYI